MGINKKDLKNQNVKNENSFSSLPNLSEDQNASVKKENNISLDDDKEYQKIRSLINEFDCLKVTSFDSYEDWSGLFNSYELIMGSIEKYSVSKIVTEKELEERSATLFSNLNFIYDKYLRIFNRWQGKRSKLMEERIEKQQGLNFTVFSLFMTVITFLLTNVVVLTKTDFSIKTIVTINLIVLLSASCLFVFIGIFMNYIPRTKSKFRLVLKYLLILLIPVIIFVMIIIINKFNLL